MRTIYSIFNWGLLAVSMLMLSVMAFRDPLLPADDMTAGWIGFYPALFAFAGYILVAGLFLKSGWRWQMNRMIDAAILLAGIWQAGLGLLQVFGWAESHHSLYALTGSFFNPGPYGCFLAVVLPLAVDRAMPEHECENDDTGRWVRYLSRVTVALIVCVLPATGSRTAWVAALASVLVVVWIRLPHLLEKYKRWKSVLLRWWKKLPVILMLVTGLGLFGSYFLNRDSANGRLLIWKVCLEQMKWSLPTYEYWNQPANFSAHYGRLQEDYFASGKGTPQEEWVAGTPEYAFNEFIAFGTRYGWGGILLLLIIAGYFFLICHFTSDRRSFCMGISLLVVSFFSYPFHFPVFWVLLILLLTRTAFEFETQEFCPSPFNFALSASFFLLVTLFSHEELPPLLEKREALRAWTECRPLYRAGAYEEAAKSYADCYKRHEETLKENPDFLFEYGRALFCMKDYDKAATMFSLLDNATGDPMAQIMLGQCYASIQHMMAVRGNDFEEYEPYIEYECEHQTQINITKAEACYKRAINRVPSRIYPYYLLTKLYADPRWKQPEKMRETARIVLAKKPKVNSPAIEEMRQEIRKLLAEEDKMQKNVSQ